MITVCSLRAAAAQRERTGAAHAISILSPDSAFPTFEGMPLENHLKLTFHDVAATTPGLAAPAQHDMHKLLIFLRQWNRGGPLLIHCWAGISRSTASAYIAQCLFNPDEDEEILAARLRKSSPSATPNPLLIALADEALGRQGRMRRAIADIGRGADAFEGTPFMVEP